MQRREPLRRGKPLERRQELRPNPEKVREFLRKHGGLRRHSAQEGPLTPALWRKAVHDASDGLCIITRTRARSVDDHRFQAHHILAKRVLRGRGLLDRVWDPRNGLWIRADVHAAHEHPGVRDTRIPAERLPLQVWEFCAELDALEGTQWATQLVLRAHPPTGRSWTPRGGSDGEGRERQRLREGQGRPAGRRSA